MMTVKQMGKLGAAARHNKPPEELREIALKAAATRKAKDPDAFKKMGYKGAKVRHDKSAEEESKISRKAAKTRKKSNPNAFKEMGRKGGRKTQEARNFKK